MADRPQNEFRVVLHFVLRLPQNPFIQVGELTVTLPEYPTEEREAEYAMLIVRELGIADVITAENARLTVRPTVLEVNGLPIFSPPTDKDGRELVL